MIERGIDVIKVGHVIEKYHGEATKLFKSTSWVTREAQICRWNVYLNDDRGRAMLNYWTSAKDQEESTPGFLGKEFMVCHSPLHIKFH